MICYRELGLRRKKANRLTASFVLSIVGLVPASAVAAEAKSAAKAVSSDYGIAQVTRINDEIREQWTAFGLTPSKPADDGKWCRRVYLDILGRIPAVDELTAFVADKSPDKKVKLVEKLLLDDRYTDDYSRNWTTIWTNVLIGRGAGNDEESLVSRDGMQKYLRDGFARNKPYDRMVYELITATGTNAPGTDNFNGAVNFLATKVNDEKGSLATAATVAHLSGTADSVHPVPQSSVQRMEAAEVLGVQRFFPADADAAPFRAGHAGYRLGGIG